MTRESKKIQAEKIVAYFRSHKSATGHTYTAKVWEVPDRIRVYVEECGEDRGYIVFLDGDLEIRGRCGNHGGQIIAMARAAIE